jgi:Met-10+ like-protein
MPRLLPMIYRGIEYVVASMGVHRLIVWIIKRVPFGGVFSHRAYKYLLRTAGASAATSYFGARFYDCELRDLIQSRTMMFGIWEPDISAAIEKYLDGGLFVDVGANIGYYTLFAASRKLDVVAIEAAPATFQKLSNNVSRNRAENVRLVQNAVSDKAGKLTIYEVHPFNIGALTTLEGLGHKSPRSTLPRWTKY